ncbi:MAG: pilin [Patescibacteria group bacterium]|nr:pilin [Patescibacteria group bacterium]
MRNSIIIALVFFSLAPAALAAAPFTECAQRIGATACQAYIPAYNNCVQQNSSNPSVCDAIYQQATANSQSAPAGGTVTLINPLGTGTTLMSFLVSILDIITNTIGPIIVILMLVFVGYKFVVAQGNPGELEKAKQALLWTVVGALVLLGAKIIALGIQATVQALSTG